MSNSGTSNKVPSNITFLFPNPSSEECSELLFATAKALIEEIDTTHLPAIDRAGPNGSVEILFQTQKRYLHINIQQDGQHLSYQGADTSGETTIEGREPTSHHFSFLGHWLDNDSHL